MKKKLIKLKGRSKWITTIILTTMLLVVIYSCEQSAEDKERSRKSVAIVFSQYYAENYLKSPSTAKFGSADVMTLRENEFKIKQSVDSQNSFGGIVRMYYTCTVLYSEKNDECSMVNFKISE